MAQASVVRKESHSDFRWHAASSQIFSDPTLEKSHPLLHNLSETSTTIEIPRLVSSIRPYYESPSCKNLMSEKLKLLQRLWNECGISENYQNDFINKYFFSSHPHETYRFISEEVMKVFSVKWLDVRLRGLIEQREYIMVRMGELVDEQIRYHQRKNRRHKKKNNKKDKQKQKRRRFNLLRRNNRKDNYSVNSTSSAPNDSLRVGSSSSNISSTTRNKSSRESGRPGSHESNFALKTLPPQIVKEIVENVAEQVQIYRTVSLYVIEYMETISHKRNTEQYYWNNNDYLLKMAFDFHDMINQKKNRYLLEILKILQVNPTRLCYPLYPSLYSESFDTEELGISKKQRNKNNSNKSNNNNKKRKKGSSGTTPPSRTSTRQSRRSGIMRRKRRKMAMKDDMEVEKENNIALEINPHFDESSVSGDNENEDSSVFLTELRIHQENRKKVKESQNKRTPHRAQKMGVESEEEEIPKNNTSYARKKKKKKLNMKTLHQYINLKPLLSVQRFRDRRKRHKKYSEPLFSVRHEDLCREASINPFDKSIQMLFLGINDSSSSSSSSNVFGPKSRASIPSLSMGGAKKKGKGKRKRRICGRKQVYCPTNLWKELQRVQGCENRIKDHYRRFGKSGGLRRRGASMYRFNRMKRYCDNKNSKSNLLKVNNNNQEKKIEGVKNKLTNINQESSKTTKPGKKRKKLVFNKMVRFN